MNCKSKGYNILLFALFGVLASGLVSCKKDLPQVVEPKPFVRILKNQQIKSAVLHRDIDFDVLLPNEYDDTTKSFPVVYLLHGWGDDETAWYIDGLIQYYVDQNAATTTPMQISLWTGPAISSGSRMRTKRSLWLHRPELPQRSRV